jgi:hypothetical protein
MGKATGWQQHRGWGGRRRRQLLTDQTPISVAYSTCWCLAPERYWKTRCSAPRIQPRSAAHLHTTAVATPVARPEPYQHSKPLALPTLLPPATHANTTVHAAGHCPQVQHLRRLASCRGSPGRCATRPQLLHKPSALETPGRQGWRRLGAAGAAPPSSADGKAQRLPP